MIDKVWSDWQYASPPNFWAFAGGMTAIVNGFIPDSNFPNGAPPYAKVRGHLTQSLVQLTNRLVVLDATSDRWHYAQLYHL